MYPEPTLEDLQKKLKKQTMFSVIHGFVVLLLFVIAVLTTLKNGFSTQSLLTLFFLPMQIIFIFEIKKIQKEIASKK